MKPFAKALLCTLLVCGAAARPQAPPRRAPVPTKGLAPAAKAVPPAVRPAAAPGQPAPSAGARASGAQGAPPQGQFGKGTTPPPGTTLNPVKPVAVAPPLSLLYGVEIAWEDMFKDGPNARDSARATQLLDLLHNMGVNNTRLRIDWAEIESTRGRYNWIRTDTLIRLIKSRGLIVTCVLDGTPSWARNRDPELTRLLARSGADAGLVLGPLPEYMPDLGRFALALANRYKDSVHRWELWNEPDGTGLEQVVHTGGSVTLRPGGEPGAYVRMLRTFTPNVRRADPTALVAIGALSSPNTAFLQSMYAFGAQSLFDAVAVHPATPDGRLRFDWIDACRNLTVARGAPGKRFWITEWGWQTYPGNPEGLVEGEQARLVREGLTAMNRRPFIDMACLQALNDWVAVRGDPLSVVSAGLCTRELQPKPALTEFAIAARHVRVIVPPVQEIGPTAAVSEEIKARPVRVDVDAADIVGRLPAFWRGLTISGEGQKIVATAGWQDIRAGLATAGASLIRLSPFRPGTISIDAGGTPVIAWDGPDALLQATARSGNGIIMDLSAPRSLSERGWRDAVTAIAHRYGKAAYGITRWELSAPGAVAAQRYPAFALAIRAAAPGTPVGIDLLDADPAAGLHRLFAASPKRMPIDSLGFETGADANQAAQTVRRLRAVLDRYPAYNSVQLLPNLSLTGADDRLQSAADVVAAAARLQDYAPSDHANSLVGAWAPLETMMSDGQPNEIANALTLLNQVAGARLRVTESSSAVRCLAARTADGIAVMLWRENDRGQDGASLGVLHLRNLPHSAGMGWQASRRVVGVSSRSAGPAGASATEASPLPFALADLPAAIADTAATGDLELPVLLSPSTVTLITLKPHRTSAADLTVAVTNPALTGGMLQNVLIQLHNPTAKPLRCEVRLSGSHSGLVPDVVSRLPLDPIPAGSTKRLRYPLVCPLTGKDTDCWVNVRVIDSAGGSRQAAILWRALSPLEAVVETPRVDVAGPGQRAEVRVRLTNVGRVPLAVTLQGGVAPVTLTLPPDGKPGIQRLDVLPTESGDGLHPAEITIESEGTRLRRLTALIGIPAPCRYTATPPAIDGDLSDWQDARTFGMGREDQWHGAMWGGPEELSAMALACWDERNFYFACTVTQAHFSPPASMRDVAQADTVLFALSGMPGSHKAGEGYKSGDHEFALALSGKEGPVVYRLAGGITGRVNTRVAIRRAGNQTIYEAAIPWSELMPIQSVAGQRFGFAVAVNHGDGQDRGFMDWGGGIGGRKRPELFPPLRLDR